MRRAAALAARLSTPIPRRRARQRQQLGLLKDLPKALVDDITPYFEMAVPGGLFPTDGGGAAAARADFDFLIAAGRFTGKGSDYRVDDFWDLRPARRGPRQGRQELGERPPTPGHEPMDTDRAFATARDGRRRPGARGRRHPGGAAGRDRGRG